MSKKGGMLYSTYLYSELFGVDPVWHAGCSRRWCHHAVADPCWEVGIGDACHPDNVDTAVRTYSY